MLVDERMLWKVEDDQAFELPGSRGARRGASVIGRWTDRAEDSGVGAVQESDQTLKRGRRSCRRHRRVDLLVDAGFPGIVAIDEVLDRFHEVEQLGEVAAHAGVEQRQHIVQFREVVLQLRDVVAQVAHRALDRVREAGAGAKREVDLPGPTTGLIDRVGNARVNREIGLNRQGGGHRDEIEDVGRLRVVDRHCAEAVLEDVAVDAGAAVQRAASTAGHQFVTCAARAEGHLPGEPCRVDHARARGRRARQVGRGDRGQRVVPPGTEQKVGEGHVVITGCVECSAGSQAAPAGQRDPDRRTRNRVGACVDREGVSRTGRPCYRDRSDAAKGSSCSGSVGGDGHGLGASIRIERHIRARNVERMSLERDHGGGRAAVGSNAGRDVGCPSHAAREGYRACPTRASCAGLSTR